MSETLPQVFRRELRDGDEDAVRTIVASSGLFSPAELDVAVELVEERSAKGDASGYHFVFLDDGPRTIGYTCYGPIPATATSYDLYWIAVDATMRRQGWGQRLLYEAERDIEARGGTRIYVDTSSRADYAPTRAFYLRTGYRQEAELPEFYGPGDGKIIYCKQLPS